MENNFLWSRVVFPVLVHIVKMNKNEHLDFSQENKLRTQYSVKCAGSELFFFIHFLMHKLSVPSCTNYPCPHAKVRRSTESKRSLSKCRQWQRLIVLSCCLLAVWPSFITSKVLFLVNQFEVSELLAHVAVMKVEMKRKFKSFIESA